MIHEVKLDLVILAKRLKKSGFCCIYERDIARVSSNSAFFYFETEAHNRINFRQAGPGQARQDLLA
jgi:hypothetical protein